VVNHRYQNSPQRHREHKGRTEKNLNEVITFIFGVRQQNNKRCIMIRKLKSGQYRLYSKKKDPKTGKRKNLGTFATRAAAEKHERAVQYFKRH